MLPETQAGVGTITSTDLQRIDAGELEDQLLLDPLAGRQVSLRRHAPIRRQRAGSAAATPGVRPPPHLAAPHTAAGRGSAPSFCSATCCSRRGPVEGSRWAVEVAGARVNSARASFWRARSRLAYGRPAESASEAARLRATSAIRPSLRSDASTWPLTRKVAALGGCFGARADHRAAQTGHLVGLWMRRCPASARWRAPPRTGGTVAAAVAAIPGQQAQQVSEPFIISRTAKGQPLLPIPDRDFQQGPPRTPLTPCLAPLAPGQQRRQQARASASRPASSTPQRRARTPRNGTQPPSASERSIARSLPGSPCRAQRPSSWRSIRREVLNWQHIT